MDSTPSSEPEGFLTLNQSLLVVLVSGVVVVLALIAVLVVACLYKKALDRVTALEKFSKNEESKSMKNNNANGKEQTMMSQNNRALEIDDVVMESESMPRAKQSSVDPNIAMSRIISGDKKNKTRQKQSPKTSNSSFPYGPVSSHQNPRKDSTSFYYNQYENYHDNTSEVSQVPRYPNGRLPAQPQTRMHGDWVLAPPVEMNRNRGDSPQGFGKYR